MKRVAPDQTEEVVVKEPLALGQESLALGQESLTTGQEFPHPIQHKRRRRQCKAQVERQEYSHKVRTDFPLCVNRLLTHIGESLSPLCWFGQVSGE